MAPLWQTFVECGWPAYVLLFLSLVGGVGAAAALVLAAVRFEHATGAASLALALCLLAAALGPVGTLWQRHQVDDAVSGPGIDPAAAARIRDVGYGEAAQCTNLGVGFGALPLLLAAGALALALSRRRAHLSRGRAPVEAGRRG